ncbi:hypothetical protein E2562_035834 [Oryza meyeriana var. granulata]|uniref:Retrotransposon gag domain-containing protein n=1 Tax=Oryza meyeriana var. granulata TaxID=110450 RepID=A0A6G1BNT2_9ORYZ|nr:hypothetical protein E2562_035834 [Oryza meyeriana var. granulata]
MAQVMAMQNRLFERMLTNTENLAHIPDGLMDLKSKEFLNLKQGNISFMDFLNRFNYLGLSELLQLSFSVCYQGNAN